MFWLNVPGNKLMAVINLDSVIKWIESRIFLRILFAHTAQLVDYATCGNGCSIFIVLFNLVSYIYLFAILDLTNVFLILVILTLEIRTFTLFILEVIFSLGLHRKERLLTSREHSVFLHHLLIFAFY